MKAMLEALMNEIQAEAATTRKVLDAVPAEKYSWKPHERSMTAGTLVTHMAMFPGNLMMAISAPFFDVNEIKGSWDVLPKNEVLKTFDEGVKSVCVGLSKLSDVQAMETWTIRKGEQVIGQMPRVAAVKTLILNHLIHHRGQMSVYLRLLDVPVPSIYGPSADDNPFA